jgi:hypothetical protein
VTLRSMATRWKRASRVPSIAVGSTRTLSVRRLDGNPIISRETSAATAVNINGPSLMTAPPWVESPLGRYYLYFADHRGLYIRLALADALEGPWAVYEPGTLHLKDSHLPAERDGAHIASPDVHVDPSSHKVRMYYHGLASSAGPQETRVALSDDGIHFSAEPEVLGGPYFRVFPFKGWWYAVDMPGRLYRSQDGLSGFERGHLLFPRDIRHSAVWVQDDTALIFWTRKGDCPERILCSRVRLGSNWRRWRVRSTEVVVEPEMPWEGADLPLVPSKVGPVNTPVRQLRDPAVFQEGERTYLLYSVAGESGIAIAELTQLG